MPIANIENLKAFQEWLVSERRRIVAEAVNNVKTETNTYAIANAMDDVVKLQGKIDVIERALAHEKTLNVSSSSQPFPR